MTAPEAKPPRETGLLVEWVALSTLGALGLFAYLKYVYFAPSSLPLTADGRIELMSPRSLGLLLAVPYFVWVIRRSLADLPWPQAILSLATRTLFVALLALGLARVARTTTSERVCTVLLVDVSQSVPEEALEDARAYVETFRKALPADGALRLVTFARRPELNPFDERSEGAPTLVRPRGDGGAGTNISAALQLAYGLFPQGYLRRVVVLTDGVETDGDLMSEAARAAEHGVTLFAVPYTRPMPGEVAVRELKLPDRLRVGEPFAVRAIVFASRPTKARLVLKQGEAINGLDGVRAVDLSAGDNEFTFRSVSRVAGDVTYTLEAQDIEADTFKENNRYSVAASVPGKPAVLYVEGQPARASYFASALVAQDIEVDVRGPREMPTSLRELERFDAVVLSDVPAELVGLAQQDALESYVRDLGGGFVFAGGENGYSLGGWAHTTVERMLPVRMDSDKRRDEPGVAMVLVIDRSGSMSGLPLEMAKAAARATADVLASDDLLEVIAFDTQPTRVVRMTAAKHRARIAGDIARIQPGGGTEIFAALDAAFQALSVTRARKKHVVLLTDGQAPQNGIRDLVQAMVAESMTVSSVGLGAGIDETLLRMVSELGGGRFYKVADPQSLPRIFTRETEMVTRATAVEEYFQPRVVQAADFLRGVDIERAPYLHGYVSTKAKPTPAQVILASDNGEPILARWHVGLGWSVAWTSDVKNLWAVEWLKWPGYGQFWGQLLREHMRAKKRQNFDMRTEVDVATGMVSAVVDAVTADDRFQNGLDARLEVSGPEPKGDKVQVPIRQTAPGRYEAHFPLSKFGAYTLRAVLERPSEEPGGKAVPVAESYGHVSLPYPREYLALAADRALLERAAAATKGRFDPAASDVLSPAGESVRHAKELWPQLVGAAMFVFVIDLLLRRVRLFDRKRTFRPVVRPGRA